MGIRKERGFSSGWLPLAGGALLFHFSGARAEADVDIQLREGGSVVARSYEVRDDKILIYRDTGELELDRSDVVAIHERRVDAGDDGAAASAAPVAASSAPAAANAAAPEPVSNAATADDPSALERSLTRSLILANRDLFFAQNRREDAEAIEKRKDEIKKLERQRDEARAAAARRPIGSVP